MFCREILLGLLGCVLAVPVDLGEARRCVFVRRGHALRCTGFRGGSVEHELVFLGAMARLLVAVGSEIISLSKANWAGSSLPTACHALSWGLELALGCLVGCHHVVVGSRAASTLVFNTFAPVRAKLTHYRTLLTLVRRLLLTLESLLTLY